LDAPCPGYGAFSPCAAILYVGSMGVLGLFSYLFIVGPLDRLTLTPRAA
ncbi:hypothetical protein V7P28_17560, partial [Klebsiella michiganensis]